MKNIEEITKETIAEKVSLKVDLFGLNEINQNKIIINENEKLLNILVIDCGIKNSQIRSLFKKEMYN